MDQIGMFIFEIQFFLLPEKKLEITILVIWLGATMPSAAVSH